MTDILADSANRRAGNSTEGEYLWVCATCCTIRADEPQKAPNLTCPKCGPKTVRRCLDLEAIAMAKDFIESAYAGLTDLPLMLADVVATGHYLHFELSKSQREEVPKNKADLEKHIQRVVGLTTMVKFVPNQIAKLRTLKDESPEMYRVTAEWMVNTIMYDLGKVESGLPFIVLKAYLFFKPRFIDPISGLAAVLSSSTGKSG